MATITAQNIAQAKKDQAQEVVNQLLGTRDYIDGMQTSALESFELWTGGLPQSLTNIRSQMDYLATQVRDAFGLEAPAATPEA